MQKLFSPCALGPLALRNPVAFLPFFTGYADARGMVTPPLVRHYKRMAASGAGLIVVEAAGLRHSASPYVIHAYAEEHVPGLASLAEVIHGQGGKAVLQICHPGRFAFAPGCPAPSAVAPFGNAAVTPKAMTEEDMARITEDFAESAAIAMKAGFDGVELHGGTGYLLASCLSPRTNIRDDAYGGSAENRARFPRRVCRAVREKVGDFPVGYRFMVREYLEGGLSLEEGLTAGRLIAEELRPAYFSVTAGTYECWAMLAREKEKFEPGYMLPEAEAVRNALRVPVIAAGLLQTGELCEKALETGMTDAIGLGRVLFADPDWLRKTSGESAEPARPCVQCDLCMKQVSTGKPVLCSRWKKAEREAVTDGVPKERFGKAAE
ncbi:NADH:flavin oxidoreductase/NADH oxidase [uncultured delta proteobacterium]|uniref:NADH:flavin oxidoreductase/NADH oxidase n=1 Tax=uncultured delta proteobacterium TaxID=34034 RepID=A0A212J2T3_9DELT|nr:NADH:flavin oxidoreductase/NADH oxidase [uncultured delta proteobacterium]